MLKWIGRIFLVLAVVIAGVLASDWLFWKRYISVPFITVWSPPLDWYSPLETVDGTGGFQFEKADPAEMGIDPQALADAAAYAGERGSDSLMVLKDGRLIHAEYWNGTGPETLFSSHSFHKTVIGLLYGIAQAEGAIPDLDAPVKTLLTEWDGDARGDITIRQMLQMASGIAPPPYDDRSPSSLQVQTFIGTDIIASSLETPTIDPPGDAFGHYNVNSMLLGAMLERATGERYADYASDRLWRPIMAHDAQVWLDKPGGMAHTDCCMLSVTEDWLLIGELMRQDGMLHGERILPEGWVAEMATGTEANPNYGLHVWVGSPYVEYRPYSPLREDFSNYASEPYAAEDVVFLDGWGMKRLWVIPSEGLVILRTGTISEDWDDAAIPNTILRGVMRDQAAIAPETDLPMEAAE